MRYEPDLDEHDYDRDLADGEAQGAPDPQDRHGSSEAIAAHIVNWRTLRGDTVPLEWDALRSFVEWFTVRYEISHSVIPVCWWKHGPLVEELSALLTAHTVSFDSRDTGYGPVQFQDYVHSSFARLRRAYGGECNSGHDPAQPPSWSHVTDEQEWTAWTTQAHAHDTRPGVTR